MASASTGPEPMDVDDLPDRVKEALEQARDYTLNTRN